jgi:hypothetical protein
MEQEIAHNEKTARKQQIETSEAKTTRTPVEQRPDHQSIAPIPPAHPYCDVPEHKRPR